jgi:hypothetical protein
MDFGGQWDGDVQRCPASRGADDLHVTAERFDAVVEPDEPGAFARIGSADAVVLNRQAQIVSFDFCADVHSGGVRILRCIGQCFGHHVIGGDLNRFGQSSLDENANVGRYRATAR